MSKKNVIDSLGLNIVTGKTERQYSCAYCGASFAKMGTLSVHTCEKKRRALARDQHHVRVGYTTYLRFLELNSKTMPTDSYEDFCASPYYGAFVRFGSFISNINPLHPNKFIDYILRSGIKLDKWCDDNLYYAYVLELIKRESASSAVERSILTMISWSESSGNNWNEYFLKVNSEKFVYDVRDGKMTPWLIFNSTTGRDALGRLDDSLLAVIFDIMNPTYWSSVFSTRTAELDMVREVIADGEL